jgi:hypothetical protein
MIEEPDHCEPRLAALVCHPHPTNGAFTPCPAASNH